MEWQQIVGFYHVAKLESFTRAAEATFRTQSALSQQIKGLEDEFGCRLFDRIGPRRLRLTPAGERFLAFAGRVLKGYEDLRADLNELRGDPKGPLRIAAPFTTLYHLFPEKMRNYLKQFPGVDMTLLDCSQAVVIELVKACEVDFGLALESLVPSDLASIGWKEVETVLMVPHGHPLTEIKRLTWKELAKYPLILPPKELKYTGRGIIEDQFRKSGLDYRIVMESSNVELSSLYVEMGLGIALATVVRDLPVLRRRGLEFLSFGRYFKPDRIALITRKDLEMPMYKRGFIFTIVGEDSM
jgi:DNA-binding transcriptional LysR family regulator